MSVTQNIFLCAQMHRHTCVSAVFVNWHFPALVINQVTVNAYLAYSNQSLIRHLHFKTEPFYWMSHSSKNVNPLESCLSVLLRFISITDFPSFCSYSLLAFERKECKPPFSMTFLTVRAPSEKIQKRTRGMWHFYCCESSPEGFWGAKAPGGMKMKREGSWWNRGEIPSLERCKKRVVFCKEKQARLGKAWKRCYSGVLLLKMNELALKSAGRQKQEFPVFLTWFKPWGDCEQFEEQGAMWTTPISDNSSETPSEQGVHFLDI